MFSKNALDSPSNKARQVEKGYNVEELCNIKNMKEEYKKKQFFRFFENLVLSVWWRKESRGGCEKNISKKYVRFPIEQAQVGPKRLTWRRVMLLCRRKKKIRKILFFSIFRHVSPPIIKNYDHQGNVQQKIYIRKKKVFANLRTCSKKIVFFNFLTF